jgi:hypothetical protein
VYYDLGNSSIGESPPGLAAAGFLFRRSARMYSTRGRPREAGDRYASGDLKPEIDDGTEELQRHRITLVGHAGDRRAAYPLGVLYSRRIILKGDHAAGLRYAGLFVAAVRPLTIPSLLRDLVGRGGLPLAIAVLSEEAQLERGAEIRLEYLSAHEALRQRGRDVLQAVEDVCIYEHWAPVIRILEGRGERDQRLIGDGLGTLERHFTAGRSRPAA